MTEKKKDSLLLLISVSFVMIVFLSFFTALLAWSHDANRPDLDNWFEELHSDKGPCCSNADKALVKDADWDTIKGLDGIVHYRVRIEGKWTDVPDEAVIRQPNLYGQDRP